MIVMDAKDALLDDCSHDDGPDHDDYAELAAAARECQACGLYKRATQAVFGEGPVPASVLLVGEQPGQHDDLIGRPFVGPDGKLLEDALEEAEIPRDEVYITNVIKHVKWERRGKRRLHLKPSPAEIGACRGWLDREIALVRPEVIVCLGVTAAQLFFGPSFDLEDSRGELQDGTPWARRILATFHPAAVLRMKNGDEDEYARIRRAFTLDLAEAASVVNFPMHRLRRRRVHPAFPL